VSNKHAATAHARGRKKPMWQRHPEDWYVEEEWVNDRLFACETFEGRIVDPACGIGRIVKAARRAGYKASGSDIVRRAPGYRVGNFFEQSRSVPNLVSNVPFRFALAFVGHSLNLAERKAALLLPAGWINGEARSRWLAKTPLKRIWHLAPRPSMPPGEIVVARKHKISNGTIDYVWLIFEQGFQGEPVTGWLRRGDAEKAPSQL
jgi:hypothetical protein